MLRLHVFSIDLHDCGGNFIYEFGDVDNLKHQLSFSAHHELDICRSYTGQSIKYLALSLKIIHCPLFKYIEHKSLPT